MSRAVVFTDAENLEACQLAAWRDADIIVSTTTGEILRGGETAVAGIIDDVLKLVTPMETRSVVSEIVGERMRQIMQKGYDAAHDDEHTRGEIAYAAASFALPPSAKIDVNVAGQHVDSVDLRPMLWPEDWDLIVSKGIRGDLIRAGAMIIAEIERLDRATEKSKSENGGEVAW